MRSSVAVWRRPLIVITALILSLLAVLIRPVPAHAETVYTVINFPAAVVPNHCNQNWVALQGELHLLVNTTPTPNGGSTVRSIAVSEGLQGTDLVTNVPYRAIDAELSFLNYVPPPGTGTFVNLHSTLLVPRGDGPTMLLLTEIDGTLASDGSVAAEVKRSYLFCHPA